MLVQLAGLLLVIIVAFANAYSAVKLVLELLHGAAGDNPTTLLGTGAAIYVTNVIVFALWYWAFDRAVPSGRALATSTVPDFLFPQMALPELFPSAGVPSSGTISTLRSPTPPRSARRTPCRPAGGRR